MSGKAVVSKTEPKAAQHKSAAPKTDASSTKQSTDIVPIVGFVGLPSAGKSSAINSLIGKHVLSTGVCRTTISAHYIGMFNELHLPDDSFHKHDPVSDDGIHFSIVDLPGVADSENSKTEQSFDELTREYAVKCDVICWVTDIRTAFLTSHEKAEYDKIKNMLSTVSLETGKLYQMFVMLAKYDMDGFAVPSGSDVSEESRSITPKLISSSESREFESDDDELSVEYEDTTVRDCLKRVESLFEGTDTKLMKFNAFGRIMHSGRATSKLQTLIRNIVPYVSKHNIRFDAEWMVDKFDVRQQRCYLNTLIKYHFGKKRSVCRWNVRYDNNFDTTCQGYESCPYHVQNCRYGKAKSSSACYYPNTCNHHGAAKYCYYGFLKSPDQPESEILKCKNQDCPDHRCGSSNTTGWYDYDKINELIRNITNRYFIDIMLRFMIIDTDSELQEFSIAFFQVKSSGTYRSQIWNAFVNGIKPQKHFEKIDKIHDVAIRDITSTDKLFRLMKILGSSNRAVQQLYLTLIKTDTTIIIEPGLTEVFQVPHRGNTLIKYGGPEFYEMDSDFADDRTLSINKKWLSRLHKHRTYLWGEKAEQNVDLYMLLLNVWCDELWSIFAPFADEDTDSEEYDNISVSQYAAVQEIRMFVMDEIGDELKPLDARALMRTIWKLLKEQNMNIDALKKAFDRISFVATYSMTKKERDAKKMEIEKKRRRITDVIKKNYNTTVTEKKAIEEASQKAVLEAAKRAAIDAATEILQKCRGDMMAAKKSQDDMIATKDAVLGIAKEAVLDAAKKSQDAMMAAKDAVIEAAKNAVIESARDAVIKAVKEAMMGAANDAVMEAVKKYQAVAVGTNASVTQTHAVPASYGSYAQQAYGGAYTGTSVAGYGNAYPQAVQMGKPMESATTGNQAADQSKITDYISALETKIYQMLEKDKKDTENMSEAHREIYLDMARSRNMDSLLYSEWDAYSKLERKWNENEKERKREQAKHRH